MKVLLIIHYKLQFLYLVNKWLNVIGRWVEHGENSKQLNNYGYHGLVSRMCEVGNSLPPEVDFFVNSLTWFNRLILLPWLALNLLFIFSCFSYVFHVLYLLFLILYTTVLPSNKFCTIQFPNSTINHYQFQVFKLKKLITVCKSQLAGHLLVRAILNTYKLA